MPHPSSSSANVDAAAKGVKLERYASGGALLMRRAASAKIVSASSHLLFRATVLATLALVCLFAVHYPSLLSHSFRISTGASSSSSSPRSTSRHRNLLGSSSPYGGAAWEREVRRSATPRRDGGMSVLVTGAAGFVGAHCVLALRARGDGVLGLDNFNAYYDPALKRARQRLLASRGVVVLGADINDAALLERLFAAVPFTHVLHLAAQAGVRYAMRAPQTYVASNVAGLVSVFEAAARHADPQPAIVWASSSSVYGLNTDAPFSEEHRTDRPASLYAATKKAGEAIAHTYNHIYGLSITGLRFFTVYGPWGRPDMAYFSFARSIVDGEPITLFRAADGTEVRRDFTYIDDVVQGCLGALDTAGKSTGSKSGKKRSTRPARAPAPRARPSNPNRRPEISLNQPASEKESRLLPPPLASMEAVFRSCFERRRLTSISRSSRSDQEESNAIPWLGEVALAGAAAAARELDEGGVPPMPSGLRWSSSSEAATAAPVAGRTRRRHLRGRSRGRRRRSRRRAGRARGSRGRRPRRRRRRCGAGR